MSQSFTELQGNDTLTNSRAIINNNFNALKSGFSGTEPPFEATADTFGSTYFNTTDNRTYQVIKQGTSYTWGLPKENLHTTGNESFSGTLDATTGTINVATQAATDNSTKAANTAFVRLKVPASVGSATKPVYTNANGVITASDADVGSASQPVYMNKGVITAITGALANNITGNSATATKLAATKKINGTDFDGSADITTNNWGTARNVVIADSDNTNVGVATSVNGSTNITLKLPATIKASLLGNASTATLASSATNATNDASGNNIANTYAKVSSDNTFTGNNIFNNNVTIRLDATLGTAPATDKNIQYRTIDKNGTFLGAWEHWFYPNGTTLKKISVRKQDGTDNYAVFEIGYDSNQNQYAWGSDGVRQSLATWVVKQVSTAPVNPETNVLYVIPE